VTPQPTLGLELLVDVELQPFLTFTELKESSYLYFLVTIRFGHAVALYEGQKMFFEN
jgi:hypothetical protein